MASDEVFVKEKTLDLKKKQEAVAKEKEVNRVEQIKKEKSSLTLEKEKLQGVTLKTINAEAKDGGKKIVMLDGQMRKLSAEEKKVNLVLPNLVLVNLTLDTLTQVTLNLVTLTQVALIILTLVTLTLVTLLTLVESCLAHADIP